MYNETQLAAIRLFGDKTLSFGCYYKYDGRKPIFRVNREGMMASLEKDKITILGHEPHWHDVFSKFNYTFVGLYKSQLDIGHAGVQTSIPCDASKPLLSQPHLSEIVNLFQ